MARHYLSKLVSLLLLSGTAFAVGPIRAVMENVPATNNAVLIDTTNARVAVGPGGVKFTDGTIQTSAGAPASNTVLLNPSGVQTGSPQISNLTTNSLFVNGQAVLQSGVVNGDFYAGDIRSAGNSYPVTLATPGNCLGATSNGVIGFVQCLSSLTVAGVTSLPIYSSLVLVSSPTGGINFDSNTLTTVLQGAATAYVTAGPNLALLGSSNTFKLRGTFLNGLTVSSGTALNFANTSGNTVSFVAPGSISSNVFWTLPGSDGSSGQVLQTNGASTLSWGTATGTGTSAYVRSGYSSRFGQVFNLAVSTQALDAIFNFTYQAPALTFITTPGGSTKELGTNFTNTLLTAFTVANSSPITSVKFYKGATLLEAQPSPLAGGGTENYTDPGPVTATAVYTAKVSDGTSTTASNAVTFTFVYPFYYGVGAQGLTPAQVQALTKLVQIPQNTTTTTSPTSQVYYFALPQTAGSLISIIDQNGFNTLAGYTKRNVTMTMLDSTIQNYWIYEFNTPTTQTSFSNTYKLF